MKYLSAETLLNPPSPPCQGGVGVARRGQTVFPSPDKGRSGGVAARLGMIASLVACLLSAPLANAAAIEKLHSFLETTKTMRANFAQRVVAKNGKQPQLSNGVMIFSRPGKFRWQVDKPYEQLLVGDGEKIWIYDPELKQVTVRKAGNAIGGTPAALLFGESAQALEKSFTLRDTGEREGLDWVEATPKKGDGAQDAGFEKLRIGFAGKELKAMELSDNFGQTTSLTFSQIERNPQIAPALLRFTPPAGVDVLSE